MSGLFSQEDFPHKGWIEVDCEDLEYDREICEACETQEIRYVHVLKHPNYYREIRVGAECADKLCENYNSKASERTAQKITRFLNSPRWKVSPKGNPHIKKDNYHITIIHKDLWSFVISNAQMQPIWGNKYKTEKEAKIASLKQVECLKTGKRK